MTSKYPSLRVEKNHSKHLNRGGLNMSCWYQQYKALLPASTALLLHCSGELRVIYCSEHTDEGLIPHTKDQKLYL